MNYFNLWNENRSHTLENNWISLFSPLLNSISLVSLISQKLYHSLFYLQNIPSISPFLQNDEKGETNRNLVKAFQIEKEVSFYGTFVMIKCKGIACIMQIHRLLQALPSVYNSSLGKKCT